MAWNKSVFVAGGMFAAISSFGMPVALAVDDFQDAPPALAEVQSPAELQPLEDGGQISSTPYLEAFSLVQNHLSSIDRYKAHFKQINDAGNVTEGTLYLARPGRARFEYGDDTPFLMVADGEVLSFVDYEVGQVTRWPVADTPLRLLIGKETNLTALNAQLMLDPAGLENHIALRTHDPEKPEQGLITVFFKRDETTSTGIELKSWVVEDAQGRVTIVELSDQYLNPALADSLWQFSDPRGLSKRRRTR